MTTDAHHGHPSTTPCGPSGPGGTTGPIGPAGRDTNVADPTTLTDPMNDPYVL